MATRGIRLLLVGIVAAAGLVAVATSATAGASAPKITTITLQSSHAYKPKAPPGATDDYHCTLVNPHVTGQLLHRRQPVLPRSRVDVHHAILFLVPPGVGQGGEGGGQVGQGLDVLRGVGAARGPAWPRSRTRRGCPPGRRATVDDVLPAGTGVFFPKGSMVVMQIHYNLLRGDNPVRSKLVLHTVPSSTPLKPLSAGPPARSAGHPLSVRRHRALVQPDGVPRRPGPAVRAGARWSS